MKILDIATELVVADAKITQYLLNLDHAEGGPKAKFFISFGFSPEIWGDLRSALIQQAVDNEIIELEETKHGRKPKVDGRILAPSGAPNIRTVWMIRNGETIARLVTAKPN